ncbi:cytochrome-c peroxidase [Pustulibacterium marinum]|nr:cytochrome c peroxidase [Pustulibacterium marinum]
MSFTNNADTEAKNYLESEFTQLQKLLAELDIIAATYQESQTDVTTLQAAVSKARLQYKKVEFYLEFHYPEYIKSHINGAPLLHLEVEGTQTNILPAEGLQILDEQVFADHVFEERNAIAGLARQLQSNYTMLYKRLINRSNTDYGEIESLRLELVRIFSMGVTGFDTPGSLNGLSEASASLESMQQYFQLLYTEERSKTQFKKAIGLFEGSQQYLKNNTDFETFDRLTFLTEYIDPLYKILGTFQSKHETDVLGYTSSWNVESESIFGANFLNPYAFTNLKKEEDSKALWELGKQLFYDPTISGNQQISCATCHDPAKGFTDGLPKSMSNVQGKTVLRNSPTLLNAVYSDRYFYDLRAFTLEQQAEHVIFNTEEFNTAYAAILQKLQNNASYQKQFQKLFGKPSVNRNNFSKALASYVLSLQSFNSPFDRFVRGETSALSASAKRGFNLFTGKANCATCHFAPTFSGLVPPLYSENESEILGVLADNQAIPHRLDTDSGRLSNNINTEEAWIYEKSFKTSTVRNIELTAPYFHNGAYATLEEVIDFYDQGGGGGMGLVVKNQTLGEDPLNLTDTEKQDLIAFMKSLTDNSVAEKSVLN